MESLQKPDDEGPSIRNTLDIHEVITDIKSLIESDGTQNEALYQYINTVQEQVEDQQKNSITEADKLEIKTLIEKHPYFKNPCNYHIRLITIMKHLKRKGVNINIKDMDLVVDQIISSIDGVVRVEYGRYYRKRA